MARFATRLDTMEPAVASQLLGQGKEMQRQGRDVIALCVVEPDFATRYCAASKVRSEPFVKKVSLTGRQQNISTGQWKTKPERSQPKSADSPARWACSPLHQSAGYRSFSFALSNRFSPVSK